MPYIEVQLTKKLERVYDLNGKTLVGRAPECNVQLLSRAVSRRHITFEPGPQGIILTDLGAPNGVKVNGVKLPTKSSRPLKDGEKLIVGDVPMTYRAASRVLQASQTLDVRGAVAPEKVSAHLEQAKAALTLPNDPAYLSNFQATVARERIEKLDISEEARLKLQIALAEAIENAVTHGSGGDPSKPIQIVFEETPEEITISVKDLGPGFNFESELAGAAEIDAIEAVRDRAKFGTRLGLRMMLDCVDRLQFELGNPGLTVNLSKFKDDDAGMLVIEDEVPDANDQSSGELPSL